MSKNSQSFTLRAGIGFAIAGVLLIMAASNVHAQAGMMDSSFQGRASYIVGEVKLQPDGKILIGGGFTSVDNTPRNFIARLNADGTLDATFDPNANGDVSQIAVQPDGKLLISGSFGRVGGLERIGLARLHADGSVDTNFDPELGPFGRVRSLALQPDGKVLVIDDFGLERVLADGRLDTNFHSVFRYQSLTNEDGSTTSAYLYLNALTLLPDGKILLGGSIPAIDGIPQGALARLNTDGTVDTTFQAATNFFAQSLLLQADGKVVVGGGLQLARFNADGSRDETFDSSARVEGSIDAIAQQRDGKIIVGGYFREVNGFPRHGIARFNADGSLDRDFDAGELNADIVTSVALQSDGRIVIGGYFSRINSVLAPYIARLKNDDPNFGGRLEFSAPRYSVDESEGTATITVGRYAGSSGVATVRYSTRAFGAAQPALDFQSRTGMLAFAAGQTSNSFTVPILEDNLVEGTEMFSVVLSEPSGAVLGSQPAALVAIGDNDTSINIASGVFALEESGHASIPVVRRGVTNGTISARFETRDGSARAGQDYSSRSGIVTLGPGEIETSIIIPIADDEFVEGEEYFQVLLSDPAGGSLGDSTARVSIGDNVSIIQFASQYAQADETDGYAILTLQRMGRTNGVASVDWATSNLTAIAGADYSASAGRITFAPGETEQSIIIPVTDDTAIEEFEDFFVTISNPQGVARLFSFATTATVRILSDDGAGYRDPRFRPYVPTYIRRLETIPGGRILVLGGSIITNDTSATWFARYNSDGTLDATFSPPYWQGHLDLFAAAADVSVFVNSDVGLGTRIQRVRPDRSVESAFQNFFSSERAVFSVQADGKLLLSTSILYATNRIFRLNRDGTIDTSFNPAARVQGVLARIIEQPDGRILVSGAFESINDVPRQGLARLTPAGELDSNFVASIEGSIDSVSLMADGRMVIAGAFSIHDGGGQGPLVRLNPDGSVDPSFIPDLRSFDVVQAAVTQPDGKVIVSRSFDTIRLHESGSQDGAFHASPHRGFALVLQGDGKVLVPDFGGAFVRLNNDPGIGAGYLEFGASTYHVGESNSSVTVALRRTGGSNGVVHVRYATINGTASSGSDYIAQEGVITFAHGDRSDKLITIALSDDAEAEGDETFSVSLGAPVGGAAWGEVASTIIHIIDDDVAIQFATNRLSIREHGVAQIVEVQRRGNASEIAQVHYETREGSAHSPDDYGATSGTLVFAPGETNKTLEIAVIDDALSEADENFTVRLSNPVGGRLGTPAEVLVTIVDNDRPGTADRTFNVDPRFCPEPFSLWTIETMAIQRDGRILIGGDFRFEATNRLGLARLLPNGQLDPDFHPVLPTGVSQFYYLLRVSALALQPDGKVIVVASSYFNEIQILFRLNANGVPDETFTSLGMRSGSIATIALQPDGRIVIAGQFNQVRGTPRQHLARLNSDGSVDEAFVPDPISGVFAKQVTALAVQPDGRILAGGLFSAVGNIERSNFARFESSGELDTTFDPRLGLGDPLGPAFAYPSAFALQPDGRIVVGGSFTHVDGQPYTNIARLNHDGSVDPGFVGSVPGRSFFTVPVSALILQSNGKLLVGGSFREVNGVFRNGLARLNTDGSLDAGFASGETTPEEGMLAQSIDVHALALQRDGKIVAAGRFASLDGQPACGIVRVHGDAVSFTPEEAIEGLIARIEASNLPRNRQRPLLASLRAALASIDRSQDRAAANQLREFQHKLNAQLEDAILRSELTAAADAIIIILDGVGARPMLRVIAHSGRKAIRFGGEPGVTYSIQVSTNLAEWQTVGAAVELEPGIFEFGAPDHPARHAEFYRVSRQPLGR